MLEKPPHVPDDYWQQYRRNLDATQALLKDFDVFEEFYYEAVHVHPTNFIDYECTFAAKHIERIRPQNILDVGSWRWFVLGLLSAYPVITLDIRNRVPLVLNETTLTSDAKKIDLPDESIDMIVSLCAIEHFGLGRYGDEFDLEADQKAFGEFKRVLKKKGHLIFTTTITRGAPAIAFNAHRIYTHQQIKGLCNGLTPFEETFYSHSQGPICDYNRITNDPHAWDVYCGCWVKP